jgi:chromosome segregation ATPase
MYYYSKVWLFLRELHMYTNKKSFALGGLLFMTTLLAQGIAQCEVDVAFSDSELEILYRCARQKLNETIFAKNEIAFQLNEATANLNALREDNAAKNEKISMSNQIVDLLNEQREELEQQLAIERHQNSTLTSQIELLQESNDRMSHQASEFEEKLENIATLWENQWSEVRLANNRFSKLERIIRDTADYFLGMKKERDAAMIRGQDFSKDSLLYQLSKGEYKIELLLTSLRELQ